VTIRNVLPDGRLTAIAVPGAEDLAVDRGSGAYIWDLGGRRYLDLLMGSGAIVLGHAHEEVVDAIRTQAARGTAFYALTEPALALAEKIVDHYPGAELLQYCSTGSEATFFALRMARMATGRERVLKFEGGFHGSNDYAMMSAYPSAPADYPHPEPTSGGIPAAVGDGVLVAPYNDLGFCEELVAEYGSTIAAIIVEPFQRNIPPVAGFLAGLRELADRCGAVLIFDEVVTGFRIAPGGAAELAGVTPDLATLGKAIGGGLPLAAIVGRSSIVGLAAPGHALDGFAYSSGTLSGNPLAAAAGLATLHVLDRYDNYARLAAVGDELRQALTSVFAQAGIVVQAFGVGALFRVLPTTHQIHNYRDAASADTDLMRRVAVALLAEGVYFTGDKGYLSLSHTHDDVEAIATAVANVLPDLVARPNVLESSNNRG
jgi:glutamate-1-semialdehyde 2,1-aminomutase